MPLQNARTALELPATLKLDSQVASTLNDRLRTIAQRLDAASSGAGASGGGVRQLVLTASGTLGAMSSAAPLLAIPATSTPVEVLALVKQPSQGADIKFVITVGGTAWFSGTITQLQSSNDTKSGFTPILLNAPVGLSIVQVGTTFPGSDLSVIVRF